MNEAVTFSMFSLDDTGSPPVSFIRLLSDVMSCYDSDTSFGNAPNTGENAGIGASLTLKFSVTSEFHFLRD